MTEKDTVLSKSFILSTTDGTLATVALTDWDLHAQDGEKIIHLADANNTQILVQTKAAQDERAVRLTGSVPRWQANVDRPTVVAQDVGIVGFDEITVSCSRESGLACPAFTIPGVNAPEGAYDGQFINIAEGLRLRFLVGVNRPLTIHKGDEATVETKQEKARVGEIFDPIQVAPPTSTKQLAEAVATGSYTGPQNDVYTFTLQGAGVAAAIGTPTRLEPQGNTTFQISDPIIAGNYTGPDDTFTFTISEAPNSSTLTPVQTTLPRVSCERTGGSSCGTVAPGGDTKDVLQFADGVTFAWQASPLVVPNGAIWSVALQGGKLPKVVCTNQAGDSCGESHGGDNRNAELSFAHGVTLKFEPGNLQMGAQYETFVRVDFVTDPANADTDGDGISDFDEIHGYCIDLFGATIPTGNQTETKINSQRQRLGEPNLRAKASHPVT